MSLGVSLLQSIYKIILYVNNDKHEQSICKLQLGYWNQRDISFVVLFTCAIYIVEAESFQFGSDVKRKVMDYLANLMSAVCKYISLSYQRK